MNRVAHSSGPTFPPAGWAASRASVEWNKVAHRGFGRAQVGTLNVAMFDATGVESDGGVRIRGGRVLS
jgi:hypothetical protein